MSKKEFCVNTLVAKVLKDYIQSPTYEELRAEYLEKYMPATNANPNGGMEDFAEYEKSSKDISTSIAS